MSGEKNIDLLIKSMKPSLNPGKFVFCSVKDTSGIDRAVIMAEFKEKEGVTLVLEKSKADEMGLDYDYVAAWITLEVHSALEAVGLTAAFSTVLATEGISCNVMAGFYHDHIFVDYALGQKALETLIAFSKSQ